MSLATTAFDRPSTLDRTAPADRAALAPVPSVTRPAPRGTAPADAASAPAPAPLRAVPAGTEARGFALYVGVDEAAAEAAGTDLATVVQALRRVVAELVPGSDSYGAVALAPAGVGGRDVDVVRLALQEPAAVARRRAATAPAEEPSAPVGVVIDISRRRVSIDGETVGLTYREFELLRFLVLREGRTIERTEIIATLWSEADADDAPNERTIDVHVRRLRSKLGAYEDIVRTIRGAGYRFDRHADVAVRWASAPSPDLF